MSYNKIVKKPVRFHSIGSDKVMVVYEDNTFQYHSVVEAMEFINNTFFQPKPYSVDNK